MSEPFQPFRPYHGLECPVCSEESYRRCWPEWVRRIAYGILLLIVVGAAIGAAVAFYALGYHVIWGRWPL